jgi:acyl-coenzyme A synthetase/AMP-(fatty) acid ligase
MILGDHTALSAPQQRQRGITVDEVFRRVALKDPERLALVDPPNRAAFTDGAPRRLTYAQADRMVSAIAGRLRHLGISTDAIVGVQLPNTVENILTILGVLRAGMIAAPMPLLWRRADAIAALARIGAKALITSRQVGGFNHCQLAMRVASEVFSIRYVCGFGDKLPDGVVPFGDLFTAGKVEPVPPFDRERLNNASAHVAFITFDAGTKGIVPVARNHLEMLTGGLSVALESKLAQGAHILSTIAPSSFAGISLTLLPWLFCAGTLSLHHPFDAQVFAQQRRKDACRTLILPGAVALRLAESGAFAHDGVPTIVGAWRSPERLATSSAWLEPEAALVDISIFGEAGFVAARRSPDGQAASLPLGAVTAPCNSPNGSVVAEVVRTATGTVALRGPMVPRHPFPPGIERSGLPHFEIDRFGLVDTGYTCRVDTLTKGVVVTGPPAGIVSVGGYRFSLHELREAIARIDTGATLAALPDPVIGQRLIGNAADRDMVQAALTAVGVNPIVAAAFRDRSDRAEPAVA